MKDRELSRFDFKATHHDAPEGSFYSFGTAWWPTLEIVPKMNQHNSLLILASQNFILQSLPLVKMRSITA